MKNYWSEFEYSKHKLLLNHEKVNSILNVLNKKSDFDILPPISVELHLTDLCNLNCLWCTDKQLRKNNSNNSKEVIFKLFDYFADAKVGVTIEGGGEPTLHKDFEEIIKYGKNKGLHLGIITNGVVDISHIARSFKWIRVSLDSADQLEYKAEKGVDKFEQVIKNLEKISKNRKSDETHLGIGYVLTKRNISTVMKIIPGLNDIGIDYAYLRPVEEAPDLTPSVEDLYVLKKQLYDYSENNRIKFILGITERLIKDNDNLPCVANSLTCIIQANGEVALCEKRRHDLISFGNVNNDNFQDLWKSPYRKSICSKLLDPEAQKGCAVCRITSFNRIICDVNKIHTSRFI